ncbi:8351_t:CDS:1, partial [Ambispora gerdemannii]
MSLLLGLVARSSRPTSRTHRITVFFLSTTTSFDKDLSESRAIVRDKLKEQGFSGLISTISSTFTKNDLQSLKVASNQLSRTTSSLIV